MYTFPLPFINRSPNPTAAYALLALVGAAIVFVIYHLACHHFAHRKARKLGHDRRHDGRHGNH